MKWIKHSSNSGSRKVRPNLLSHGEHIIGRELGCLQAPSFHSVSSIINTCCHWRGDLLLLSVYSYGSAGKSQSSRTRHWANDSPSASNSGSGWPAITFRGLSLSLSLSPFLCRDVSARFVVVERGVLGSKQNLTSCSQFFKWDHYISSELMFPLCQVGVFVTMPLVTFAKCLDRFPGPSCL